MTMAQLHRIGLPYFGWKSSGSIKQIEEAGKRPGALSQRNLSDHLLRDIGLLDGHEAARQLEEPACSSRDLIDRYR
jgi:hypothetical protein